MEGRINGRMEGGRQKWMDERMEGLMEGWRQRWIGRWIYGRREERKEWVKG